MGVSRLAHTAIERRQQNGPRADVVQERHDASRSTIPPAFAGHKKAPDNAGALTLLI
jgi:hypothetical protein